VIRYVLDAVVRHVDQLYPPLSSCGHVNIVEPGAAARDDPDVAQLADYLGGQTGVIDQYHVYIASRIQYFLFTMPGELSERNSGVTKERAIRVVEGEAVGVCEESDCHLQREFPG
jgi:hypothetical protein